MYLNALFATEQKFKTNIMTENKEVTSCCGSEPHHVDGTNNQCLMCGEMEVDIITLEEFNNL